LERGAALTSRLQSFETELLTQPENLAGRAALNRELVAKGEAINSPRRVVVDMDGTEVPVYGWQEQSAYNGHFESTCYHPLLLFYDQGDCVAAQLRAGNVHGAEGWVEVLLPEIDRRQAQGVEVAFRGDVAFAKQELYEALEKRNVRFRYPPSRQPQSGAQYHRVVDAAGGQAQLRAGGLVHELSGTRPPVGVWHGEWWRRWSSTLGRCSHGSASSRPI
jgi:Transposase DDE domain group 1